MMIAISANGTRRQLENWSHIQWQKAYKLVKNLRQRIFRARKLGNFKTLKQCLNLTPMVSDLVKAVKMLLLNVSIECA